MKKTNDNQTYIIDAHQNNLKHINVVFPHNKITVITGVSGSGKSTLANNVIYRESQRRFFSSTSGFTGKYLGKIEKPLVSDILNLQPALIVNQRKGVANPRSTAGTLSDIYDYLRLLFARCGTANCLVCNTAITNKNAEECPECHTPKPKQLAQLFSFNSVAGACDKCKGLGVTERISIKKLIADENLSLREGALVPTTPTGYIVYSQVTVDSLNEVCKAHGFNVDIPWKELTEEQKNVIMYGSERVKILFGKHSLESRLKWKGITAKPREEGYYKGMIPIMEEILKRDRNGNILRFAESVVCDECNGKRLRKEALSVFYCGKTIDDLSGMSFEELHLFFTSEVSSGNNVEKEIISPIIKRTEYLLLLGLGYLTSDRESASLSGGEYQRIKLAQQAGSKLQNILYILDEPSAGLHPHDNNKLINLMRTLRDNGNTLLVAEHERDTILSSDFLIDIGPGAGVNGGELLYQGISDKLFESPEIYPESITAISVSEKITIPQSYRTSDKKIIIRNASIHNLKNITVQLKQNCFNVITGVSGAGKSTLIHDVLGKYLSGKEENCNVVDCDIPVSRVIEVDQSPIGRTSRSNPATYTDLFALVRTLFAKQPESVKRGYKSGRFSFNNKGGRCEKCQGAGVIQTGMHFLGNVEVKCDECDGHRFNKETLEIKYKNKNIWQILEMSVDEAYEFFESDTKIRNILGKMMSLGIGYLKLGQPSTTLSGGEAQRIKLASELYKSSTGHNLYILDEPTLGLHISDVKKLYNALNEIVSNHNTVVVIEHDPDLIINADHIVDLGPYGGDKGGNVVFSGTLKELLDSKSSLTAQALRRYMLQAKADDNKDPVPKSHNISFHGVTTNNLKNIDVEIPTGKINVITGISGSGKSSLAFDTIYSESRNRFTENMSTYARRMMQKVKKPDLEQCNGLTPSVMIDQKRQAHNPRSTVATASGVYDYYRLLFSRAGTLDDGSLCNMPSSMFSYNNTRAACPHCNGLGVKIQADPDKFITNKNIPITNGAMNGSVPGKFFGDPFGRYINTLLQVGSETNMDFTKPYDKLSADEKKVLLYGTGDKTYNVKWEFKRGKRSGIHELNTTWDGFIYYFTEEYEIRKNTVRGHNYSAVTSEFTCDLCHGNRLIPEVLEVKIAGKNISQFLDLCIDDSIDFLNSLLYNDEYHHMKDLIVTSVDKLTNLKWHDLGYISLSRVTSSLSGGESQRLRIANQLVNGLTGMTYILDEPTMGLHPDNTHKLLKTLTQLKESGNTIIMVEHDPDVIKFADNIIEMGPGAGSFGGEIIAKGTVDDLIQNKNSITGRWLKQSTLPVSINKKDTGNIAVRISGANAHNLKNLDITIPKGCITIISGVSGSGKSSLAFDVIADSFTAGKPVKCNNISFNNINNLNILRQGKITASPLSTTLTWCGLMNPIQDIYSNQQSAKDLNLKKSHFSTNSNDGKCPTCKGNGFIKVSLDFLNDVWVVCDDCEGARYKSEVLKVKYKGLSIADILTSGVNDLTEIFADKPGLRKAIETLNETGLGYLKAGQPLNTLSGGELQRLALAKEIIGKNTKDSLYILDEPTTGLHMQDVAKLVELFNRLTNEGSTLLIIEHNKQVINIADKNIVLGPEGGNKGGYLINNLNPV